MNVRKLLGMPAPSLDEGALREARERQLQLTKPAGSLGALENVSIQLAGIYSARPVISAKSIMVFAGDHGVAVRNVSAYPREVTRQMVKNFRDGGAAINALARLVGARLVVVDVGVLRVSGSADGEAGDIRYIGGTRDLSVEPALSEEEVFDAVDTGMRTAEKEMDRGANLVGVGEMGIGNTTSAAAITAIMCKERADVVTGPGTGVAGEALAKKAQVVASAVGRVGPTEDPLLVLRELGGFEIAALVGAILRCVQSRVPVVLDGFVVGAAALVAQAVCPGSEKFFIAGHRSKEPGHRVQLQNLGLDPLLDLGLRLGEGTGACLAIPLIEGACRILSEMRTFEEAAVSREDNN